MTRSTSMQFSMKQKLANKMVLTQMQRNLSLLMSPIQQLQHEIMLELEHNPALEISKEPIESLDTIENERYKGYERGKKFEFIENLLTMPETLSEHLTWQLHMEDITEKQFEIGKVLIENLDRHGFMIENPYELCTQLLHADASEVDDVISLIQELDPIGCCTANVFECLHVQLNQLSVDASHKEQLDNCLKEIEQLQKSKKTFSEKQVDQILHKYLQDEEFHEYLKLLVPYPGLAYAHNYLERDVFVIPDAIVSTYDGELRVEINHDIIPELTINSSIQNFAGVEDKKIRDVAHEWIQSGDAFIKGLEFRESTLKKVIQCIVFFQKEFFKGSAMYLKPMTRKMLADTLQLHESTISRALVNKYIQTDLGIFPLKYFFSQRLGTGETSNQHIKLEIMDILATLKKEGKKISDRIIMEHLIQRNIKIARRTVAKYRLQIEAEQ